MGLDFSRVKKTQVENQSKGGNRVDFAKVYFKPALGKQKVRIVPWKEDKTFPFIEVQLHKYDTFKKYIPTLSNWSEVDPILKFREKVYKDVTSTKEDKDFMKNLSPKTSTFIQVIVRGQEDQGVRLWELNVTNRDLVMSIAGDGDEYGDITDISDGRDLIVEGNTATNPKTGKTYTEVSIKPSVKTTPLSTDTVKIKEWLENQYVPLEQYKRLTAEELKLLLQNFLNPKDESDDDDEMAEAKPAPAKVAVKAPAKAPTKKAFVKLEEEEESLDPELAEEEDPELVDDEPAVVTPKKVAPKKKPVVLEEVEEVEEEDTFLDEMAEAIPVVKDSAKTAAKPKVVAPKEKVKPLSVASKFDSLYDDDED